MKEEAKTFLENLIEKASYGGSAFKRNVLKEYLQILALDFIYSSEKYNRLIFYGGSCLSHCFGLPRMSEDLDFVDAEKRTEISRLAKDLEKYFRDGTDLTVKAVIQKFRIYIKFPMLHELKIADRSESDLLFLKVEIFKHFDFCKNYRMEIIPLFKFNKTVLVRTFDLPTLMATKIEAVLRRKWEKTDRRGRKVAFVKGRDYFDLMWYLEKGVKPNLKCLRGIEKLETLKKKLMEMAEKLDIKSVKNDLEPLIGDYNLVKNLSRNLKDILRRQIKNMK